MTFISTLEDNRIKLPRFEHKGPPDDDCGLPENPIFSDYAKYLWPSHTRTGGIQSPNRSRESTEGDGGKQ